MKIRYTLAVFTVLMLALFSINYLDIRSRAEESVDMGHLNAVWQEASAAISEGRDEAEISEEYGCEVILRTDADYRSRLMSAVREQKILLDYEDNGEVLGKLILNGGETIISEAYSAMNYKLIRIYICLLMGGYVLIGLVYIYYIRPFKRLQDFAAGIAKGDLDAPLCMQKSDYFGAFTESFDLMREELKRARENEYRANLSKKELVAELSHDMKTPVATIKATCDVLKAKAERMAEDSIRQDENRRQQDETGQQAGNIQRATAESYNSSTNDILEKVRIIEDKANMIDQLISNMFNASLQELETLKVVPEPESSLVIMKMFGELKYYSSLKVQSEPPECLVYMDALRLRQVIDNIVGNAYKYAGTDISVSFHENEDGFVIEFRDYGSGVDEEELPLITEKFYRGENGRGKSGAGLGLFLAKYFMENMKGGMECYNDNGFVVNLFLRKV